MSPELERLLAAPYERDTCEPRQRPQCEATLRRPIDNALAQHPGVSREAFVEALKFRMKEFRRARRMPPTMPPKA